MNRTPLIDLALSGFVLTVAAIVFSQTTDLPPGLLDVLGSARVPQGICIILAVLALIHLVHSIRNGAVGSKATEAFRGRYGLAATTLALTVLYAAVLHTRALDFGLTTTLYVLAIGLLLNGIQRRALVTVVFLALIMGFGLDFIFTRFFYVDLP